MAPVFPFKTRNPDRDRASDQARIGQFAVLAAEIGRAIAREHEGLAQRRQREADDAAFLMEAAADGEAAATAPQRLATLSASLMAAERRLALLERQLAWLDGLTHTLNAFPTGSDDV